MEQEKTLWSRLLLGEDLIKIRLHCSRCCPVGFLPSKGDISQHLWVICSSAYCMLCFGLVRSFPLRQDILLLCCIWSFSCSCCEPAYTLMSSALTEQLSCALLSFSIPYQPAYQVPREAMLCSSAVPCHFPFAFPTSLRSPVTRECLLLAFVNCHNRVMRYELFPNKE